jgi:hypothetical protein
MERWMTTNRVNEYTVRIKGQPADEDDLEIDMGRLQLDQAWWQVPLPACPDCGGDIAWDETEYVAGTRKCLGSPVDQYEDQPTYAEDGGCGSIFSVRTDAGHVTLRRERFY